ncbi:DnaJ-domain-containing protein [Clathrospora elynae]|uniref:DnaJ-domain-containing protein n=1 Tax=Clathrospora elynae TaxID=706981 RepID=A0A6A5SPI7_9PLEO|nr:DnaJ-domain-containing protein [Clathrospora elynae]
MDSEPLPDHYRALGVDKSADASTIKATYRKLVLKCHPDKVTDPALKEQKQEEFHQIQQAYEVLIDDEKRADYEAHLTLDKLRKEKAARGGGGSREKTARFDVRTSNGASFTATGPSRYATEERKPSYSRDDSSYFGDRTRGKHDSYDAFPSKYGTASRPSRPEKETASRSARAATTDRSRSDRDKTRAKESRSERKFVSVESESSSDEKARYEAEYKRRSAEDEARRQTADATRKAEDRRSYEDTRYAPPTHHKMSAQEEEAIRYQHKSRGQVEAEMARPSPTRASSRDYYAPESRSARRDPRPDMVRRSSARPGKDRPTLSRRDTDRTDRGIPEVVDWADDRRTEERRPPSMKQSSSSPAELARGSPQRSYTTDTAYDHRRTDDSAPPPAFHRSATMGSIPHAPSSRRKDPAVPRPSSLREAMTPEHNSASAERDTYASVPSPQPASASKTTYYRYPTTAGGGVTLRQEDLAASANHRTVLREPARHLQRSPSPLGRPPIGPNRPSEMSTSTYSPIATAPRPSMGVRTDSNRNPSPIRASDDHGRSGKPKLYGEVGTESRIRGGRQPSFNSSDVQYARKYGPEDVRWAQKANENERGYASKPSLGRTATFVY